MRQRNYGPWLSKRTALSLLLAAVLVPSVGAYINGVKVHDTRKELQSSLSKEGWTSTFLEFADPISDDYDRTREVAKGVKVTTLDNPAFRKYVLQLVSEAIRSLPEMVAGQITVEQKREIARATAEALAEAVSGKKAVEKLGRTGSLAYRVGTFAFETTREVHEGNKLLQSTRRNGLVPFVALKLV